MGVFHRRDAAIIIPGTCYRENGDDRERVAACRGSRQNWRNFQRLANRPNGRTNYHPESQQSVPFSSRCFLRPHPRFSSSHHEKVPPCAFDLSRSQRVPLDVSAGLPRGRRARSSIPSCPRLTAPFFCTVPWSPPFAVRADRALDPWSNSLVVVRTKRSI